MNINYRYKPDEVRYILDNSDAQTLIYHSEFRDAVVQIHNQLPKVKTFIEVNGAEVASFAENYETLATKGDGSPRVSRVRLKTNSLSIPAARPACRRVLSISTAI
ncbi:MAG: hypothetical protein WDM89_00185 [Rhizomicrobium sp.]